MKDVDRLVDRLVELICDRVVELWPVEAEPNPGNLKANNANINQFHTQTGIELEHGLLYQRGRCASDQEFITRYVDPKVVHLRSLFDNESSSLLYLELPKGVTFAAMVGPLRFVVDYAISTDDFVYRFDVLVKKRPSSPLPSISSDHIRF